MFCIKSSIRQRTKWAGGRGSKQINGIASLIQCASVLSLKSYSINRFTPHHTHRTHAHPFGLDPIRKTICFHWSTHVSVCMYAFVDLSSRILHPCLILPLNRTGNLNQWKWSCRWNKNKLHMFISGRRIYDAMISTTAQCYDAILEPLSNDIKYYHPQ